MGSNHCVYMLVQFFPNQEISVADRRPGRPKGDSPQQKRALIPYSVPGQGPPLDLAPQPSQSKRGKRLKRHPMGKPARHRILKYSALMVPESRDRQVFLTGTLPGSTSSAVLAFSHRAADVVKLVQTYLPRSLGLKGKDLSYVWVWEHQKRGALHIHIAVETPTAQCARELVACWHRVWGSVLRAIDAKVPIDLFARRYGGTWADRPDKWQADAALVRKSVGKYLSKYLSKGGSKFVELRPPRWYGVSSNLRVRLKEWIGRNTWEIDVQFSPEIKVKEVTDALRETLSRYCVGEIGSRADRSDPCSLWLYGYISTKELLGECILAILNTLNLFGDINNPSQENRAFYASNRGRLLVLRRIIRYEWPTWLWIDVNHLVPSTVTDKLHFGEELNKSEIIDLELAFRHSVSMGFGSTANELEWVKTTRVIFDALVRGR